MAFDLKTFKERLGLPCTFSADDVRLQSLLDEVKAAWKRATFRPKFFDGDTESTFYLHGSGSSLCSSNTILLPHRPCLEVVNIWVDTEGAFGQKAGGFADDPLTAGTQFYVDNLEENEENPCVLYEQSGWGWPSSRGSVKMTARVGYTADGLPADVVSALFSAAAILKSSVPEGRMLQSERIGNYSYSLFDGSGSAAAGVSVETENTLSSIVAIARRYREVVG